MVSHIGSNSDYHFIMKQLAEEYEVQFECLREKTKKCIIFSVPIEKENKSCKTVTYKIELINSGSLMPSLLSSLAYNLAKGIHKDKCRNFKSDLECMTVNDVSLVFKCVECNKTYEKEFDGDLTKRSENKYRFCDSDIDKFCLMFQEGVYPYNYMDSLLDSMKLHCQTKMNFTIIWQWKTSQVLTTSEQKKVLERFWITKIRRDHSLYVQNEMLLLPDVFESLTSKCIEIYELDPAYFLPPPGVAWQVCLKKAETEFELLIYIWYAANGRQKYKSVASL